MSTIGNLRLACVKRATQLQCKECRRLYAGAGFCPRGQRRIIPNTRRYRACRLVIHIALYTHIAQTNLGHNCNKIPNGGANIILDIRRCRIQRNTQRKHSHIDIVFCKRPILVRQTHYAVVHTQAISVIIHGPICCSIRNTAVATKIARRTYAVAVIKSSMTVANPWIFIVANALKIWTIKRVELIVILGDITKRFRLSRLIRPTRQHIKQCALIIAIHGQTCRYIVAIDIFDALCRIATRQQAIDGALDGSAF
mmetsp:Transcript_23308/g.37326  ORF Transcript_23308/g.37326 Transcript_23308/m.37326 type:complete len:254 (+) Transcript_23308:248-1009(+)